MRLTKVKSILKVAIMTNPELLEQNKRTNLKSILKVLILLAGVVLTIVVYHLNSKVLFEGYEYGKLEGYTLEVILLPQTKETRDFLLYTQKSIADGKLTKWEKNRIESKYKKVKLQSRK